MLLAPTKASLSEALRPHHQADQKIVFVPTMGALHEGHASLLRQARRLAGSEGIVVASIFLNPTQFDRASDLSDYPVSPEADVQLCEQCGVDVLFMPTPEVMYASNASLRVEELSLSSRLCGATRPGHFAGVCLVVLKLFNLVRPTDAIFGEKDFQQLAIIRRMVRDLDVPVEIHAAPTLREPSGLALSSRNRLLSPEARAAAPSLYAALLSVKAMVASSALSAQDVCTCLEQALSLIPGAKVDYVELVDAESLTPISDTAPSLCYLATAVYFGDVRLIDHVELSFSV